LGPSWIEGKVCDGLNVCILAFGGVFEAKELPPRWLHLSAIKIGEIEELLLELLCGGVLFWGSIEELVCAKDATVSLETSCLKFALRDFGFIELLLFFGSGRVKGSPVEIKLLSGLLLKVVKPIEELNR
jgi:hypothetical protein